MYLTVSVEMKRSDQCFIPLLSMTSQRDTMVMSFIGTKGKEDSPSALPGRRGKGLLEEARKGM
jgi:hypothetical protein